MDPQIELVRECLKGRSTAQKRLYDMYAEQMLGVCYRYTKSLMDAEDVMQDGFIKVFRNLHQYRQEGDLGAWIRRIMVNTAINYLKKSVKYQTEMMFEDTNLHLVTDDTPTARLGAKELADLVRQLPTGYQTVFNLHAVEGFAHGEIGQILGISEGTSRSQYMRARNLLMQWIEKKETLKTEKYAGKRV